LRKNILKINKRISHPYCTLCELGGGMWDQVGEGGTREVLGQLIIYNRLLLFLQNLKGK
jgi:hypothetical protein